jgi:hypothetical protein
MDKIKRFLTEFKTKACPHEYPHKYSLCFFHHEMDERRNPYTEDSFAYYPESEIPPHHERNKNQSNPLCLN